MFGYYVMSVAYLSIHETYSFSVQESFWDFSLITALLMLTMARNEPEHLQCIFKKKEESASNYNVYAICWVVADLKKKRTEWAYLKILIKLVLFISLEVHVIPAACQRKLYLRPVYPNLHYGVVFR